MIYRQDVRHLGETLQKKKNWRKGMILGGQTAELAGNGLVLASPMFGALAPEVALAGGTIGGVGRLTEKLARSNLLK